MGGGRTTGQQQPPSLNFFSLEVFQRFLRKSIVLMLAHELGSIQFQSLVRLVTMAIAVRPWSISAQSYEFYPHLAQLDNLDFTLSHMCFNIS